MSASQLNPNSEIEGGARTPRVLLSAPSRKTRAHRNDPSARVCFTRKQLAARRDQILTIPTGVRKLPKPIRTVIGDLSDTAHLLVGLDLHAD